MNDIVWIKIENNSEEKKPNCEIIVTLSSVYVLENTPNNAKYCLLRFITMSASWEERMRMNGTREKKRKPQFYFKKNFFNNLKYMLQNVKFGWEFHVLFAIYHLCTFIIFSKI